MLNKKVNSNMVLLSNIALLECNNTTQLLHIISTNNEIETFILRTKGNNAYSAHYIFETLNQYTQSNIKWTFEYVYNEKCFKVFIDNQIITELPVIERSCRDNITTYSLKE